MRNYKFKVGSLKNKDKELKKIFKKCKCCNEVLLVGKFSKRKVSKDGYRNECQKCCYEKAKVRHTCICQQCGKEFPSMIKDAKFCDQTCMGKWKSEHLTGENSTRYVEKYIIKCDYCKADLEPMTQWEIDQSEHHFCSKECYDEWQKGRPLSKERREAICKRMKENPPMKGKTLSEEAKQKISDKAKERYKDISNHPRYNPDLTEEEREKGRNMKGLSEWRNEVYKRDNYTCQCCGDNRGGNLNAHHINGYNWDKDNRTNINNGITLCKECHDDFHKIYGRGNNTLEQFKEFILNKNKKVS